MAQQAGIRADVEWTSECELSLTTIEPPSSETPVPLQVMNPHSVPMSADDADAEVQPISSDVQCVLCRFFG